MQRKKNYGKKKTVPPEKIKKEASAISGMNVIDLVLVVLYVLAEFVPRLDAVDVMGGQWLYLSILNCICTIHLLKRKKFIPNRFFKTLLFFLYGGFIFISGLSFFVAYNIVESLVTYSRLLISFIAFLNILSIILANSRILKPLFLIIGLLVLYQSLEIIIEFLDNFRSAKSLDLLIYNIKGNTGNKNILAASMVIKIPFLIYAVHQVRFPGKIFYSLSLLLSLVALFIVNARSSYVGLFLELIIYFILITTLFLKNGRKISLIKIPGLITVVFISSIIITQLIFSSAEKSKPSASYGGVVERVESISMSNEGSSGRLKLWNNALDFIKSNPLLGGGYGNWKIHSCNYERYWQPGWGACMGHVHNDFLEMIADTGIAGGLLYSGIFLFLFLYVFAIIRSPEVSLEKKMIHIAAGMALVAYAVDSLFNFPLERANVQILFAFSAAIVSFGYIDYRQTTSNENNYSYYKKSIWFCLLLAFATMYVSYEVFKSMQVQNKISVEWIGQPRQAKVPFNSEDVNPYLPWIPNINGSGMPMACVKAKYLCQEEKYDEALALLNNDKGSNPYLFFGEYLRSMIALSRNQPDSAFYYAKLAYYNRPANLQLYEYLSGLATERKDSVELNRSFKEITKWYPKPDHWIKYAENLFYCTGNEEARRDIIRDGLMKYPGDGSLLFQNNFLAGLNDFKMKSYASSIDRFKEALRHRPGDPSAEQNIGFSYLNLGLYNEALPFFSGLINKKTSANGKNEYFRGICYINLNKKDSACIDFINARSMGYPVNPALLQDCR